MKDTQTILCESVFAGKVKTSKDLTTIRNDGQTDNRTTWMLPTRSFCRKPVHIYVRLSAYTWGDDNVVPDRGSAEASGM